MPAGTVTAALQQGNPGLGTVSRRPQTTGQAAADPSVPFVRLSRRAKLQAWVAANVAFGTLVQNPLKAAGGYLRGYRLRFQIAAGTSTGAVVAAADAPWNLITNIFLRDPFGQPIFMAAGWETFLIQLFSGQCGNGLMQDPRNLPSFSAIQLTSGAGAGNATFELYIPLEFDSAAYCCLASLNASAQPSLAIQLAPAATVYTTPPTTLGNITVTCTEEFWSVPTNAPDLAPPGIGSSAQWSSAPAAVQVASASSTRVPWPRVGTYIHTMIGTLRDQTGARVGAFPLTDLSLYVDGVPIISSEPWGDRIDDIYRAFAVNPPTGVIVATFRQSVREEVDNSDTHDVLLPTTPATLLEIGGTWGTIASGPGVLTCLTGELYPIDGLPYNHLSQ